MMSRDMFIRVFFIRAFMLSNDLTKIRCASVSSL
jgi:hypothetical protein